jgi:hypothetical protein
MMSARLLSVASFLSWKCIVAAVTGAEDMVLFKGFDAFPHDDVGRSGSLLGSLHDAKVECEMHGYGGFVVNQARVYFRAQSGAELIASRTPNLQATLFVVQNLTERATKQPPPSFIAEAPASISVDQQNESFDSTMLLGIFTMDSESEFKRRNLIRRTYIASGHALLCPVSAPARIIVHTCVLVLTNTLVTREHFPFLVPSRTMSSSLISYLG